MASSMSLKLACVAVLCMVVGAPLAQGAVTCGQVTSSLAPCIGYLTGNGAGGVPPGCLRPPAFLASTMVLQADSQASAVSTSLTRSALALTATASSEVLAWKVHQLVEAKITIATE
uniref:Bifunctional inhibitor/plant lipid transfer protein/seed storage helical domain-containing protein n=1 Tax=Gossypium raimondii TaxID=29730 RepID=A0A0D2T792_GOSRA|nr:hypothetical protein B456_011G128100 [Gossypium raimondii]